MSAVDHHGWRSSLWLAALAAPLLFTAYDQSHWWAEKEDYGFGWLTPVFTAYVLHERWPEIRAALEKRRESSTGLGVINLVLWFVFAGSLALFSAGGIYRAAAGASFGGTLAVTLGSSMMLLAGVGLVAGHLGLKSPGKLIALFLFPALVWLVSAPMLTVVENNLSTFLRAEITKIVFGFFDLLGFTIEQQGNILLLPTGQVGVEEACSGIRSLTGCLFAGAFLAATFTKKNTSKILLIGASLALALFTNLLRSLFLTAWALAHGAQSIEGTVHDVSGYAVLGLTVILLLLILPFLERQQRPESLA